MMDDRREEAEAAPRIRKWSCLLSDAEFLACERRGETDSTRGVGAGSGLHRTCCQFSALKQSTSGHCHPLSPNVDF